MPGSRLLRDGLPRGSLAPLFDLPGLAGGRVRLHDYAGRPVLVVFSDPHCPPCMELAPQLETLTGLAVVVISRGDPEENREKAAALGLTYPIGLQEGWRTSREYGIFSTPAGFLVGPDGRIARPVALGTQAILAAARGEEESRPAVEPDKITRRTAIFRFAAASLAALAAWVDPLRALPALADNGIIPLDLSGTWQLRDDLGGNRCSPNNPNEASFTASKASATFTAASTDCQCCACSGRQKVFTFPTAFTTVGAHLKGAFKASRSGQYALASFRVDLLIGGKVGTTKFFTTEHRPNNNCTVPGTETLIPNGSEFDIPMDSIAVGTIDGIALAITGYGCCEATAAGTLTNTRITLPGAVETTPSPATHPGAANAQNPGFPWAFLLGLGAGGLVLLGGLRLLFGFDPCEELRKLCAAARAAAEAAAAKAKAARAKATAAHKACDDARKVREKAERLTKPGESWIEGSAHPGERLTSGDLALQRQAAADLRAAFDRGDISRQELEDGLSRWADPAYWKELRDKAQADLKGAQEREAAACKAADEAEAAAAAAEAEAASLAAQAAAICKLAAECVEQQAKPTVVDTGPSVPVTPTPPAAPATPTTPTPPSTQGQPHKPDDHGHAHAPQICCPSGEYYGVALYMEGGMGSFSWLWDKFWQWLTGDEGVSDWFDTGHDYWTGYVWCKDSPGHTAGFNARSIRQGWAIGGGAGVVLISCSGYDHPADVILQLPSMMSGLSGDIAGLNTFVKLAKAGRYWRQVLKFIAALRRRHISPSNVGEVGEALAWIFGEGVVIKGIGSSYKQGAPGCFTIPIGLSVQIGAWYNQADNVTWEVDSYSCCTSCGQSLAKSGRELVQMKGGGW